ncbi:MAG TPA: hypothetical protein VL178_15725 [Pseudomonas sp.]|nr:hypothetical protein [Pseudomonas sp.]
MTENYAIDAIDAAGYGLENAVWLKAVMGAIALDVQHNQGQSVAELASLGHYLADDCANYLRSELERLKREQGDSHA